MNLTIVDSDAPEAAIPEKKRKTRHERFQDGTLILTEKLSPGIRISLKLKSILGDVQITHQRNEKELLPEGEKGHFKNIPDLDTWPTNGIIEVWTPTGKANEYTVVKYQRLR